MSSIERFYRQNPEFKNKKDIYKFIDNFNEVIGELLCITNIDDYHLMDVPRTLDMPTVKDGKAEIENNIAVVLDDLLQFISRKVMVE